MIHGLLHGIRRCLLRVTQGFAARRRLCARRKRGGFMAVPVSTCLSKTVPIPRSPLRLSFWWCLRCCFRRPRRYGACHAPETPVAADSGALAGANVVSSYHTAATVVDASI